MFSAESLTFSTIVYRMSIFVSPLRYPGGKLKVVDYIKRLFEVNDLKGCTYIEPYAGGASVALSLLFDKFAGKRLRGYVLKIA